MDHGGSKGPQTFKVVVVGDCNVGKTCLFKRYVEDTYDPGEGATLGSQLYSKKLTAEYSIKPPGQVNDDSKSCKSKSSSNTNSVPI